MEGEPPARSRVGFYSPQPRVSPFVYNFYYYNGTSDPL
jgi:hypothetical protein